MEIVIEQWLSKFDPSTASLSALVFFAFFFICLFIWKLFWPWFKSEYWPLRAKLKEMEVEARVKAKQEEVSILSTMRDAVVEFKGMAAQQLVSFRQQEAQIATLLTMQSTLPQYLDNMRMQIISEITEAVEAQGEKA